MPDRAEIEARLKYHESMGSWDLTLTVAECRYLVDQLRLADAFYITTLKQRDLAWHQLETLKLRIAQLEARIDDVL